MKFDDFVNESLNANTRTNIYNIFFTLLRIIDRKSSKYHITYGPLIGENRLPDEDDLQTWMDYVNNVGDDGLITFKIVDIDDTSMDEIKEKYLDYITDIEYDDADDFVFSIPVKNFLYYYDDIKDCFDWITL